MSCEICAIVDNKLVPRIYEDDKIVAVLSKFGYVQVFPKKHYTILEQVEDDVLTYLLNAANKLSSVLFEALKVGGTNIILNNGVVAGQAIPHIVFNIVPRKEEDGLKYEWTAKKTDLLDIENRLRAGMYKPKPVEKPKTLKPDDKNYLIRQLRRLP